MEYNENEYEYKYNQLHDPVMLEEAISNLNIKPNGIYIDMTTGLGGHSIEIAKRLDKGKLICIDRDNEALKIAEVRLKEYGGKIDFVNDNFKNVKTIIEEKGIEKISGALGDFGLSGLQIASDRGFSYMENSPIQMTMDKSQNFTAAVFINTFAEDKIRKALFEYGDERFSGQIAREIVKKRTEKPIETTLELVDIIKYALRGIKYEGGHVAKRTFQAIRCYVNQEMENIEPAIEAAVQKLESGGRLITISFQSGEDRTVKNIFKKLENPCECSSDLPCVCGKKATVKIITKKPIYPSDWEKSKNPRAHSARMRVLEKL